MLHYSQLPQFYLIIGIFFLVHGPLHAQELEPRSITNVPIGTNFAVLGYNYAQGSILFDPALTLEDVTGSTNTFVGAWVRAYNFFGMSAKSSVILPFVTGSWTGTYQGEADATDRTGIADLRLGFSFNFIGAPALAKSDYAQYKQKTIVGFSMKMVLPTGQYFENRLINLGSNRWAFRPQLTASHRFGTWYLEYAINTWFYTANPSFVDGYELKQHPIGNLKMNVVKSFKKGIWAAVGVGYATGGRMVLNDQELPSEISNIRFGAIVAVPLHPQHSLKFSAIFARRFKEGNEFNTYTLSYQFLWNRK